MGRRLRGKSRAKPLPESRVIASPGWNLWGRLGPVALLALAVFVAYQPVWHAGFIWDDDAHVTRTQLRTVHGLWRIWTDPAATQQYYPLTHSMFWVQSQFFGDNPLGYHLVNVTLHAVNSLLAWRLLHRLGIPGAGLAAAVFALHPVMVESVAWVAELKNTLSGLFYLSAMLVYLEFAETRQTRPYTVATVLFVLALLSKTVTATLPAALVVVAWWQRGRLSWAQDVVPLLPWFGLGAAAGLTTAWIERSSIGAKGAEFELGMLERCLLAGRIPWFYLGKLLWPTELMFVYPRWQIDSKAPWHYLYPALTVAALLAAWRFRHRSRSPLAALLFFGGTLFPVLGFLNVYPFRFSFVADHFQYLASLGIFAAVGATLTVAAGRWHWLARGLGLALLLTLAAATWRQSRTYSDAETLWRHTLDRNPTCWMAHNNLGLLLGDRGRHAEEIDHYEQAIELKSDYAEAHGNLGIALIDQGRAADAMMHLEEAIRIEPGDPTAHYNLGVAMAEQGRLTEAFAQYNRAIQLNPDYGDAHNNLAAAFVVQGRFAAAIEHYDHALRVNPNLTAARSNLGAALVEQGRLPEAIHHLTRALQASPDDGRAHYQLARALTDQGRPADAITHCSHAAQLLPESALAQYQLGKVLSQLGRWDDAIRAFVRALRLNPDDAQANNDLGIALVETATPALRDTADAVRRATRAVELSRRQVPEYLDTFALACAADGRWTEAVKAADEAVALAEAAGRDELAARIAARRERYRQEKR